MLTLMILKKTVVQVSDLFTNWFLFIYLRFHSLSFVLGELQPVHTDDRMSDSMPEKKHFLFSAVRISCNVDSCQNFLSSAVSAKRLRLAWEATAEDAGTQK